METTKRSNEVDIIRMAAIIGICMVNVPFMALPAEYVFIAPDNFYDKSAAFFVECFFQMKFFLLFSFIFGWGMAVQSRSAQLKGQSFRRRYFRRMIGLAVIGITHAILVFSGDILVLYAVLGAFLWLIKDYSTQRLIKIAAWMLPLTMLFLIILAVIFGTVIIDKAVITDAAVPLSIIGGASLGGSFFEATQFRIMDWPITFSSLLLLQGPLAFGAFALGLAAAKTNFFSENSYGFNLLQRYLPLLLVFALPLNVLYAAVVGGIVPETYEILSLLGFLLIAIGAPALSLIYLYFLIRLSRIVRIPSLLVLAGRNSLSSYVAAGVWGGIIFGSYGLGLFNSLGHAALLPLSLIIALMAIFSVGICAKIFGRGPLEPILRKISGH